MERAMTRLLPNMTSSRTGTLYFAYGSNLSPEQMAGRCISSASSSVPVAITRLDGWRWFICERGYANIAEVAAIDSTHAPDAMPCVWGVLYNMTPADEAILDYFEGCDSKRFTKVEKTLDPVEAAKRPFLQGACLYNKLYLPVQVTKWLRRPEDLGIAIATSPVTVLAYVDEFRTREGNIKKEYVGRMNRAIRESVELGVPAPWVQQVMRKWVVANVEPPRSYFGTGEMEEGW